jgi:molybdopterin converting factor small subunit
MMIMSQEEGLIEVHLYGRLRRFAPDRDVVGESVVAVPVRDGETVGDVVRRMGMEPQELSHIFLNAEYSGLQRKVRAGDRLGLFPFDMGLLYKQYFPKKESD